MKKTIALAAVLLLGSAAVSNLFAQGQILWGNQFTGALQARVYGLETAAGMPTDVQIRGNAANGVPAGTTVYTGPLLSGTGFTMALFLGNDAADAAAQTTARGTINGGFRTGNTAGFVFAQEYQDPTRVAGTTGVNVQFRAWDNRNNTVTSWAQVMAAGGMIAAGSGAPFTVGPLGGVNGTETFNVPSTLGARSFNLTQIVPEPSLIALGALGLGALLLRRRK